MGAKTKKGSIRHVKKHPEKYKVPVFYHINGEGNKYYFDKGYWYIEEEYTRKLGENETRHPYEGLIPFIMKQKVIRDDGQRKRREIKEEKIYLDAKSHRIYDSKRCKLPTKFEERALESILKTLYSDNKDNPELKVSKIKDRKRLIIGVFTHYLLN